MFNKLFNAFKKDDISEPAIDLSLGYPRLQEFKTYLLKGNYKAFESEYEPLIWDAKTALNEGIGLDPGLAQYIQKWVKVVPESYISNLFAGVSKTGLAWIARTSAAGNAVGKSNAEQFMQLLDEAFDHLKAADDLNAEDPEICARIIRVFMGLGVEQDVVRGYFDAAAELVPNHLMAHLMMINFLTPKWRGSLEEMQAFANEHYQKAGSSLLIVLPLFAMVEEWLFLDMAGEKEKHTAYFSDERRKAEVIGRYKSYIEEADGQLLVPYVYNYFAFLLYKFKEPELFKELVGKINGRITVYPWAYIGVETNSRLLEL